MKNLIRHILKESTEEKFINTILNKIKSGVIKAPYFKNLKKFAADDKEIEMIFKKLFGEGIRVVTNTLTFVNNIYNRDYGIFNNEGNQVYFENSIGFWNIWEYDERGNLVYEGNSYGWWEKKEYDEVDNLIYKENSRDGALIDKR